MFHIFLRIIIFIKKKKWKRLFFLSVLPVNQKKNFKPFLFSVSFTPHQQEEMETFFFCHFYLLSKRKNRNLSPFSENLNFQPKEEIQTFIIKNLVFKIFLNFIFYFKYFTRSLSTQKKKMEIFLPVLKSLQFVILKNFYHCEIICLLLI